MEIAHETLRTACDARGLVFEPLRLEEIAAQKNVHVVFTRPGAVRGNHYHHHATEIFAVVGPALVRVRAAGVLRDFDVPEGETQRFTIPPLVSHAVRHHGTAPGLTIAFSTHPHDPANPDTHRDVLIDPPASQPRA
jgi:dTDP-4-dehydrorhamnose 3,5-epimerase-like enzyme